MALRIGLLNGENISQDYDFGYLLQSLCPLGGYIEGLEVTAGSISAGKGFIPCERTNGNKPFVFVELDTAYAIDTTGTKKVWIHIDQAMIDDGSGNAEDGTGVATIVTGASYPATGNYMKLASITGGAITDERVSLQVGASRYAFSKSIKDLTDVYNFTNPGVKKFLIFDVGEGKWNIGDVESTDVPMPNSLVETSQYMLGEAITSLDNACLFIETGAIFSASTVIEQIAYDASSTRFAFPFIANGTAFTTLKLSLRKYSSPSVNLNFRIEGDNAGSPDGTPVANGTATIDPATLSTSLADTTVTMAGSVALTAGTKYWIVIYSGTYGSETTNTTNYYGIGTYANDTAIRGRKLRGGASRGAVSTTKRAYISCVGIADKILALTDADFAYKISLYGISTETKAVGTFPKITIFGISNTTCVEGNVYFLSNIPGAISNTPGTNSYGLGTAVSTNKLFFGKARVPGDDFLYSTWAGSTVFVNDSTYHKKGSAIIDKTGYYRINIHTTTAGASYIHYIKIYKNGVAYGVEHAYNIGSDANITEDLLFQAGDTIEFRGHANSGYNAYGYYSTTTIKYNEAPGNTITIA